MLIDNDIVSNADIGVNIFGLATGFFSGNTISSTVEFRAPINGGGHALLFGGNILTPIGNTIAIWCGKNSMLIVVSLADETLNGPFGIGSDPDCSLFTSP